VGEEEGFGGIEPAIGEGGIAAEGLEGFAQAGPVSCYKSSD
jgi:F0F1-type ATP synthase membrane subunit c/vacuolar-type H+-ATPase subunit K